MRIPTRTIPNDIQRFGREEQDSTSTRSDAGDGNKKVDIVTLGTLAREMAVSANATLSPAIQARLEQVRQQLKDNEYTVDFQELAANILSDEIARSGESE